MMPRDQKDLPTAEQVRALLDYDPRTGELRWKPRRVTSGRPMTNRRARIWNERWAGKTAGGLDANGYWRVTFLGQTHYAHRVIFLIQTGEWPSSEIDHKDGNPSSNYWRNLRLASRSENLANQRLSKRSKTGFKGVYFSKSEGRYVAQLKVNKRQIRIGCFDRPEQAHKAYVASARKHYGPFARAA